MTTRAVDAPRPSGEHRSPSRKGGVPIVTLALLSFAEPLGSDIYLPGLPAMAQSLHTTRTDIQLSVTAFLAGLTLGHLAFGPLSDRFGRRRPLIVGTALAAVCSAACALAPSASWLLTGRLLQGLGAASGLVIARAIVSDVARGPAAARLYGTLLGLVGVAPIVAPLVGGPLLGAAGWRAVFWLLSAGMTALLVAVVLTVPDTLPQSRRRPASVAAVVAAAGACVTHRRYLAYAAVVALAFGSIYSFVSGAPFLLEGTLGLGVSSSAVVLAAILTVHMASALTGARLANGVDPRVLVATGLAAMLTGSAGLGVLAATGRLDLALVCATGVVFFAGTGLVLPNATAVAFAALAGDEGTGSALLGALQNACGAAAAPFVGLVGAGTGTSLGAGMAMFALVAAGAAALGSPLRKGSS